jgi:hypothetical protein
MQLQVRNNEAVAAKSLWSRVLLEFLLCSDTRHLLRQFQFKLYEYFTNAKYANIPVAW